MLMTPIWKIRFKQMDSSVASNDRSIGSLINSAIQQFSKKFSSRLELWEKIIHKIKLNADAKQIRLTYRNKNFKKRKNRKKLWKIHFEAKLCTGWAHNFVPVFPWSPETSKSWNMLSFCRSDQKKKKNRRRTKEAFLLRNSLTVHKLQSLTF